MDIETTLSNTVDTPETGDTAPAADTPETGETGSQVIVMQGDTGTTSVRSVSLDAPTVDSDGLPAVVRSVFGDYHQRTQTVTEVISDGTSVTSTEPVPGLAGLDWYWLSGVFLFTVVLWSFFRFLGVVFKR